MRIIYFTKYTRMGASSRMRSYQYFPLLEIKNIEIDVSPLFPSLYLNQLYKDKKISKILILKAYCFRFIKLFSISKFDKVVIEKELFPYLPSWSEWLIAKLGVRYIVDYDDAIFHNYDLNENSLIKFGLRRKIDNVMRYASKVIVGNEYLEQRAKNAGARKIVRLPTVVDITRYSVNKINENTPLVIGWIGSPSTTRYLNFLKPVFLKLRLEYEIELHIIGGSFLNWGNWVKQFDWKEDTEVANIRNFDIGIMPLDDSKWEKGKCAYKLIQYMACGLPVIASPVGMNTEVVIPNVNGFLASTEEQWFQYIKIYLDDSLLRSSHGKEGRKITEERYSLQAIGPKLAQTLIEDE